MPQHEFIVSCPRLKRLRTTLSRVPRHRRAARAGFTFVEMVIASALLAILAASLYTVFSFSLRSARYASDRLANLNRARAALEYLCSRPYADGLLAVGNQKRPLPNLAAEAGYYSVTEDSDGKVKDITVVVEWTDPWGTDQSVSVTTSRCKGLHK